MNDTKEDAQALFAIARRAHEPTSHERDRVLRRVLARGAIAAGVTSANVGAAAAKGVLATSRAAAGLKILAGFALLSAAGTGAYRVSTAHSRAPAVHAAMPSSGTAHTAPMLVRAPERLPAVVSAPAAEQSPNAAELPKPRASSSPGVVATERVGREATEIPARRDERAVAPSPAEASALAATQNFPTSAQPKAATNESASTATLTREARALADVQRALREGRSSEALVMLAAQSREFAGGALGQEREAARIMALCAAGRAAEGRLAAERFLTLHAGSPVATHIRSSCGVP